MTTAKRTLTDLERAVLGAALDRLVPPIDDLPGAGTMGLVPEVEATAGRHAPYFPALLLVLERLVAARFDVLSAKARDAVLSGIEKEHPAIFNTLLEVLYLAYYSDPRVQRRIGWRSGPLQPLGFPLAPFDEAILETARRRKPLWRPVEP
jgi:hypothetical protein